MGVAGGPRVKNGNIMMEPYRTHLHTVVMVILISMGRTIE